MSEIPGRPDRDMTPEQEASAEDLAEKRGISIDMAERAILGLRIEPTEPVAAPRVRKLHQTGHVHDYESDRDHEDAALRAEYKKLTPEEEAEQREIAAHGRALIEAKLDEEFGKDRRIKAIQERVEREIPIRPDYVAEDKAARERLLNARLRAYFDRQAES